MSFSPPSAGASIQGVATGLVDQLNNIVGGGSANRSQVAADFPINANPLAGKIIDQFINWGQIGQDGLSDFNKIFGYEFVITKMMSGNDKTMVVDKKIFLTIPPSSISMNIPSAVNLSVTQNGILEESNAAPLRSLTISGTTGVLNVDLIEGKSSLASSILDYAFKNTIQAVNRVGENFNRLTAAITGNPAPSGSYPLNIQPGDPKSGGILTKTGFYEFHNLARFFDYYLAIKKTAQGRNYRLHFNMYKDRMYYDVTLNNFSWQKAPGTVEYSYTTSMTAWKQRSKPAGDVQRPDAKQLATAAQDPLNVLARVVNTLRQTRRLLSSVSGVIRGIRADADDVVFGPLREIILLGKDIVGVAKTLADFPQSILQSGKASILSAVRDLKGSSSELSASIEAAVGGRGLYGDPATPGSSALNDQVEARASSNLSDSANQPESSSPSEVLFQDPISYVDVFDQIDLNNVPFSQAVSDAVQAEQDRVNSIGLQDLIHKRDKLTRFSNSYAERIGAASATFNRVHSLNPPPSAVATINLSDIQLLASLNDIIIGIDQFTVALKKLLAVPQNDYFRFYVNYAVNNGLNLQDAGSKFLVPFPVGATLESLAVQYLGNIDRWPEIAAINGLKSPYIDEDGYLITIKANGSNNTILLPEPGKLYVGVVVYLFSDTQRPKQFKITKIEILDVNNTLITFENDDDTTIYKVADNAQIKAYLPDTINSTKLIAVPSPDAPNSNFRITLGPGVNDLGGIAQIAQTDFLINSEGDWVITSGGDLQRAFGYTNLVQAARIKLLTTQGSMLQRPSFGNPAQPGISVADLNLKETIKDLNEMFLSDPRFSGILASRAVLQGPAVFFDLLIGVSGVNINLPITTVIPAR